MTGTKYDTAQEGPFWRVRRPAKGSGTQQSNRKASGQDSNDARGLPRNRNAQPLADSDIREIIRSKTGLAHKAADAYTRQMFGRGYAPIENSESSLRKQGPIGQAFNLAAEGSPEYKQAVFEAYKAHLPEAMQAKDYDDLLARAYNQLAHETKQQFHSLPVDTSYHRNGEGNYPSSKHMLADIYNNKHLNVFQGGDRHDFLHEIDPETGLNTNEMFRAVHDFYGHGVHGTEFGPKGEEKAWAAHSGMFSPLAQAALTAETRGQNSVVNYTPLNAEIKRAVRDLDEKIHHARRSGRDDLADAAQEMKRDLLSNQFQNAPQTAVLLPPEMNRGDYAGGVPSYLRPLIKPKNPAGAELTHFSNEPNLTETDPRRYGTGIKGAEAERLQDPAAVRDRTYFYAGNPERGEQGLGTHKYHAKAEDLYDVASDPQGLHALAREHNVTPWTAKANQGLGNPQGAFTDLERLAHEHGYGGVLQRNTQMPMAALFKPVPVKKSGITDGGSTTDLDAMKLALMGAAKPRMSQGGNVKDYITITERPL